MKKHELIKYAYDNYPKGTKFKSVTGIESVSNGKFSIENNSIIMDGEGEGRLIMDVFFEQWAEIITEEKKPLLTSEDGVDLYEDDLYNVVYVSAMTKKWELGSNVPLNENHNAPIKRPNTFKAFSTKKAALDWIEKENEKLDKEVKVGDVVKGFDSIDNMVLGKLEEIDDDLIPYKVNGFWLKSVTKITKEEVIKLLFDDEKTN